tara:strand:- start:259 stop:804 length:546 start_codon:yes stop_codon:yes gene_type:complete
MNEVFKFYNVCDDVADKIARKVHQGYQEEINKRIKILVNFDWYYNYWAGGNTDNEIPDPRIYIWIDNVYHFLDCEELDINEYSYMCNRYKVFSMNRYLRRNILIAKGIERFQDELYDKYYELIETKKSNSFNNNPENISFLERTSACLECKYNDWQRKIYTIFSISLCSITNIKSISNLLH